MTLAALPPTEEDAAPLGAWCAFVDSLPDAAWIVDACTRRVVAANSAAVALLARPAAGLIGEAADALIATPEDLAFWDEAAAGAAPRARRPPL